MSTTKYRQRYTISLTQSDAEDNQDLMGALGRLPGGFDVVSGRGMLRMSVDLDSRDIALLQELVPSASIRDYVGMPLIGEGRDGMIARVVIVDGEPALELPHAATQAAGLAEGDEVSLSVEDGRLVIKKLPA
jgi:hypothetical protein